MNPKKYNFEQSKEMHRASARASAERKRELKAIKTVIKRNAKTNKANMASPYKAVEEFRNRFYLNETPVYSDAEIWQASHSQHDNLCALSYLWLEALSKLEIREYAYIGLALSLFLHYDSSARPASFDANDGVIWHNFEPFTMSTIMRIVNQSSLINRNLAKGLASAFTKMPLLKSVFNPEFVESVYYVANEKEAKCN